MYRLLVCFGFWLIIFNSCSQTTKPELKTNNSFLSPTTIYYNHGYYRTEGEIGEIIFPYYNFKQDVYRKLCVKISTIERGIENTDFAEFCYEVSPVALNIMFYGDSCIVVKNGVELNYADEIITFDSTHRILSRFYKRQTGDTATIYNYTYPNSETCIMTNKLHNKLYSTLIITFNKSNLILKKQKIVNQDTLCYDFKYNDKNLPVLVKSYNKRSPEALLNIQTISYKYNRYGDWIEAILNDNNVTFNTVTAQKITRSFE